MMLNYINPWKTRDFEMVMDRVAKALAESPDPIHQQMAAGWHVLRARGILCASGLGLHRRAQNCLYKAFVPMLRGLSGLAGGQDRLEWSDGGSMRANASGRATCCTR